METNLTYIQLQTSYQNPFVWEKSNVFLLQNSNVRDFQLLEPLQDLPWQIRWNSGNCFMLAPVVNFSGLLGVYDPIPDIIFFVVECGMLYFFISVHSVISTTELVADSTRLTTDDATFSSNRIYRCIHSKTSSKAPGVPGVNVVSTSGEVHFCEVFLVIVVDSLKLTNLFLLFHLWYYRSYKKNI